MINLQKKIGTEHTHQIVLSFIDTKTLQYKLIQEQLHKKNTKIYTLK